MKRLIALEPHGIVPLDFAYLYILRLSSVYQMELSNNRQQEKCRFKQSYFFIIDPKNPSKVILTFIWVEKISCLISK